MTLLILGLGNPGSKYQGTRHNAGFHIVELLASQFNVKLKKSFLKPYEIGQFNHLGNKYILVKPLTFMNNSGAVIPSLLSKYKLTNNNLLVVVDNLDIAKGLLKFKLKGSDGGHNGLKSINDYIGTQEYKRLFVGIGRPEKGEPIVEYVLSKISDSRVVEAEKRAAEGILKLSEEPINQVINFLNRRISDKQD